jgi:hypothetical protein
MIDKSATELVQYSACREAHIGARARLFIQLIWFGYIAGLHVGRKRVFLFFQMISTWLRGAERMGRGSHHLVIRSHAVCNWVPLYICVPVCIFKSYSESLCSTLIRKPSATFKIKCSDKISRCGSSSTPRGEFYSAKCGFPGKLKRTETDPYESGFASHRYRVAVG